MCFLQTEIHLQLCLNMESPSPNANEKKNHRKITEIPAYITLIVLPMQHK